MVYAYIRSKALRIRNNFQFLRYILPYIIYLFQFSAEKKWSTEVILKIKNLFTKQKRLYSKSQRSDWTSEIICFFFRFTASYVTHKNIFIWNFFIWNWMKRRFAQFYETKKSSGKNLKSGKLTLSHKKISWSK